MLNKLKKSPAVLWILAGFFITFILASLGVVAKKPDGSEVNFLSLLPPLWTVILAFAFKRVFVALGAAIVMGGLVTAGLNPLDFIPHIAVSYFWSATVTQFKLYIFLFTVSLVGMVNVTVRAGGIAGAVELIAKLAKTPRAARLATGLAGVMIFFDDYANTVVVGTAMRKLTDKFNVSREKLAYIVDSTSAPVAGLAVISTWIGYEVGLLGDIGKKLGLAQSGYELFFTALPFRFYCVFALIGLFINALLKRDFGPMLEAERRAKNGLLWREGAKLPGGEISRAEAKDGIPLKWWIAAIPIIVVITATFGGIIIDGGGLPILLENHWVLFSFDFVRDCFSKSSDNVKVLAYASLSGSLIAVILSVAFKLLTIKEALYAWFVGAKAMSLALLLLIFAWGVAASTEEMGTAYYLSSMLKDTLPPLLIPLTIFLISGVMSFATGTSWGTMAIMLPTAVPFAYNLGGEAIAFISMAAVLDGSIFGDHCSPISDTTVMSSIASACDHIDHVRTQLPYAFTAMFVAALAGYVPAACGLEFPFHYLLGASAIFLVYRFVGKPI